MNATMEAADKAAAEFTRELSEYCTIGAGVTLCGWSDRKAATVVAVASRGKQRTIVVKLDRATLVNGPESGEADALVSTPGGFCAHVSGSQRYTYEADQDGAEYVFTLRRRSYGFTFVRKGEAVKGGMRLIAGRHAHHDFNF